MMSEMADNAMVHEAATTILQGYFEGVRKAIRGQM
jgi:flagellar basal body rod protein FlgB